MTPKSILAVMTKAVSQEKPAAVWLRHISVALLGTVLLTLSAKLKVPFYPVPMTMQTLVVLLLAATCGLRMGSAIVLAYLVEGALGLPVLADTPERGIGLAYMMGPTGGYLAGFLVAAMFAGLLADRGMTRSWLGLAMLMIGGHVIMFGMGYSYLGSVIGFDKAWAVGVVPFLPSTAVKVALGMALLAGYNRFVERKAD
jgi:biotin transport system substrate-specific component